MLSLRDIVKTYTSGDSEVHALQGVSIAPGVSYSLRFISPTHLPTLTTDTTNDLFVPLA